MNRATAHATAAGDTDIASDPVERVGEPDSTPLYAVATRKVSGAWRTFDTFVDPQIAAEVCALLKSFGAETRIELIEQPIP